MPLADLMTFQQQLDAYPAMKKLLTTVPKGLPVPISPAWIVYGRRDESKNWGRKEFDRYQDAFHYVKPRLSTYHDISITCKRKTFNPPGRTVKVTRGGKPVMVTGPSGTHQQTKIVPIKPPPAHLWCLYCRRFTIFTWFRTHHAFRGDKAYMLDPTIRRCCICGVRESGGAYRG